jgi:hypothetical protein
LGGHPSGSGGVAGTPTTSGGTGGAAGAGGAGGAGGSGGMLAGGAGGTHATTTSCGFMCAADFPCSHDGKDKPKCVLGDPSSISVGRDVSCQEVCHTPCCTGGGCRMETNPCGSDTVCVYTSGSSVATCLSRSLACGGALGNTCGPGKYCEFFGQPCSDGASSCAPISDACAYVNAGAAGICQALPSESECAKYTRPVCGCDGVTYKNDCARRAAGVAASYSGECLAGTGGVGGSGGSGGSGGRGGAGGSMGDGGDRTDGGPQTDAPTDAFCTGTDNKIGLHGKTWVISATSKCLNPTASCCMDYAIRLHSQSAVGEDLEAVLRFTVGSLKAGTYSLLSQAIGPTIRSSVRREDAGSAEPILEGTVVISGAPEDDKQAWRMGLCAQIRDPSSQWQALQIYVPGVAVAPSSWSSRFRMWRLKDPSLRATDVASADINKLELASQPLLDLADVDFVEPESTQCALGGKCSWVGLNTSFLSAATLLAGIKGTATSIDLGGVPFVVETDGERIYLGAFQTAISSVGAQGPDIMVEGISDEGFAISPPPGARSPDLRNDPRIIKVLTEAGKIP